jgi:hypothetical protein
MPEASTTSANKDLYAANGTQGSSYLYDYGTSPNTRVAVSQKVRLLAPSYGSGTNSLNQMGVVSSFNPSISRNVDAVRGIGFGDMIAELVPSVTEPVTGSLERALLYLANLWQATGYAGGVDGPVRSLAHHRWPFDIMHQLVFSSLADNDLGVANVGATDPAGSGFGNGTRQVQYPTPSTPTTNPYTSAPLGHSAIITMYEACWFTSWSATYSQDSGQIMESGDVTVSDVHDFASVYGEFLPTGNDPTVGQLGSIRYGTALPDAGLFASGVPAI